MNIQSRIQKLRTVMRDKGIDAYIIPSSDPHQSEYVAEYFSSRAYITGFTGSFGSAVITLEQAGLWTDGRYFVQAEEQLQGTGVTLYKMNETGVATIEEFLKELNYGSKIGFDGNVLSVDYFRKLSNALSSKDFIYEINDDLIDTIWDNRPQVPSTSVISHDVTYTGKTREEKLTEVMSQVKSMGASYYVISGLDDLAWILNIRGRDIPYNPLTIAYLVLSDQKHYLFIDEQKLGPEMKSEFIKSNIYIMPYEEINHYLEHIKEGTVLIDPSKTNLLIYRSIKVKTIDTMDITTKLKAIKNEIEVQNIRNAMVRDGVYMVKFIHWIKETIKKRDITEVEAANHLEAIRSQDQLFYDSSFATISAYKESASMPHYHATETNQKTIKPRSLYLIDSGAQYLDGTTDITRTLAMGELSQEEKTDFTLVLKGMIHLSIVKFIYGSTGTNLDIIARLPLWNVGMDYKHGTGHGIGFFLNVHEGPHRIAMAPNTIKLEHGMVMSNEPGVYKPNKHGIRIENIIVVRTAEKTQYGGQFMNFETLTLCPIDLEAIDFSLLTQEEKNWLNEYHQTVYNKLSPYLELNDLEFLKQATKSI